MSVIKIQEHNAENNEIIVREATAQEIIELELQNAAIKAELETAKAEATAKAAAKADLLERLGITEDEAKLLLS